MLLHRSVVASGRGWAIVALLALLLAAPPAVAQWVEFVDETGSRLSGSAVSDDQEKDFAWGDVDQDGDIDLVVVRKEPFTTPGKRTNLLLINEFGVFVDRTFQYARFSDVEGDQGFLTPTNDRDVQLADLDGDGWLDIVTAVTISDGDPKHIGHPRIYMNQGSQAGVWQGFLHEDARIPEMLSYSGATAFNPRFCSVAVGDVTGDGFPDLWFGDYDSAGVGSGSAQPPGADFNDRLLINDGTGFFSDETTLRLVGGNVPSVNTPFEVSAFGAAAALADIDVDGTRDIVKQTSLNAPLYVGVAYNQADDEGFFDTYDVVYAQAPYFVSVGDLNNDGLPDLVITDDGQDRYLINQGPGPGGTPDWIASAFSYSGGGSDDGFGANSVIADLDGDGFQDVLIADVDTDIPGCGRRMHLYRNLGGAGGVVTLAEPAVGTSCGASDADCSVAGIPTAELRGVHDVAVFDINFDGWLDLIVGRCDGTRVLINQAPAPGVRFSYPVGLPFTITPDEATTFEFKVDGVSGGEPQPGTGAAFASLDGAPFAPIPLTALGGNRYEAELPAAACNTSVRFYVSHDERYSGDTFTDPTGDPGESYSAQAGFGTRGLLEESFEGQVPAWTVIDDPSLTGGTWEQAVPVGTLDGLGNQAAPDEDAEAATDKLGAMVTANGLVGGAAADSDVDGGPTDLISPAFDLAGSDGYVTYSRWFFSSGAGSLEVAVSNDDGASFTVVETVTGDQTAWTVQTFRVGAYVTPTAQVRVRFRADDSNGTALTEAAIDLVRAEVIACSPCTIDADCDDGVFCNGEEVCGLGVCGPGATPCGSSVCDDTTDSCVDCVVDQHCDDGGYCNGAETCAGSLCQPGVDPCAGGLCSDVFASCVECLTNAECDDGVFCNGAEACQSGSCAPVPEACPGRVCDEDAMVCLGTVALQARPGEPLLGLTSAERVRFDVGRAAFGTTLGTPDGLGPTFNQNSCSSCHNTPVGGSGSIVVTRFGSTDPRTGAFDPLTDLGGSLLQAQAVEMSCAEVIPVEANVTAQRATPSMLGFGLVEAIDDAAIEELAASPPGTVSGRVHWVEALEAPEMVRAGRFGWKSQLPTVLSFSADAASGEMGITNRLAPTEHAPNGDLAALALCDTVPDPEDGPDGEGLHLIDRLTDFQRFLAPPPQTPRTGMLGEVHFSLLGCSSCHRTSFTTPDDPGLEAALRDLTLRPYSDFLLHDMGQTADFIGQGDAEPREVRTTPLWGIRLRDPLWHDGRVTGGTFEDRILAAVNLHDALGSEAQASAQSFNSTAPSIREAVVAFLDSLGRVEFDHDGDGDVDGFDIGQAAACADLIGTITPNQPCAVSDVDQDGDVDADDHLLLNAVADVGVGGSVPDGTSGDEPLRVEALVGGDLRLTWDPSCASGDQDYAVYEGAIGAFDEHRPVVCSTGGALEATFAPQVGARYFLVVPTTGLFEGSHGTTSAGIERQAQPGWACLEPANGRCDD